MRQEDSGGNSKRVTEREYTEVDLEIPCGYPEESSGESALLLTHASYTVRVNNQERFVHENDLDLATFHEPGPAIPLPTPLVTKSRNDTDSPSLPTKDSKANAGSESPRSPQATATPDVRQKPQVSAQASEDSPDLEHRRNSTGNSGSAQLRRSTPTSRPPERYGDIKPIVEGFLG